MKHLLERCFQIKPLTYLAIALFSPFFLALLASITSYFINKTPINISGLVTTKEFPRWSLPTFFIYNLIFFGFGEEVGWRGFALPQLLKKSTALVSSIFLTLFWAFWHLPLFFYRPGYTTMGWAGILGWVFSLMTGSILLTWLYKSSRASILICAVFHSTIDIAFTTEFADKNTMNYMGIFITIWGIITVIFLNGKIRQQVNRTNL